MNGKRAVEVILVPAIFGFFFAACSGREPREAQNPAFPCAWPASPGFAPTADIIGPAIVEPSGIAYHPGRRTLFVVSDQGEVVEIRPNGGIVSRATVGGDLEGATIDPATGLLYVVIEGEDVILEIDPESKTILRRFAVDRACRGDPAFLRKSAPYDNGLESLAFVPDPRHPEGGTFYAGNQEDPSCLMELSVPVRSASGTEAWATIVRALGTDLQDPSGMYFDAETRLLNIVCDAPNLLLEVRLDGTIARCYAFPGNDQEGVCRDPEGFIYIAQDSGGILKLKDLRRS
jgi:uncharacterized protein YjiK